jgi:hypothetical protein
MKTEFRIVFNGHIFKIQKKVKSQFYVPFIIDKYLWIDVGLHGYGTIFEARSYLASLENHEEKLTDWKVVE